uniref:Uncharacterized protein n=1 Tax=Manihot esculenta TaxID=3983 RepID=A0A2C9VC64_MANES
MENGLFDLLCLFFFVSYFQFFACRWFQWRFLMNEACMHREKATDFLPVRVPVGMVLLDGCKL